MLKERVNTWVGSVLLLTVGLVASLIILNAAHGASALNLISAVEVVWQDR